MTDPTCQRCGKSLWLHAEMDYTGETDIAVCEEFMKENDEIFQAEYRTRMTRSMSDEEMAREMYEAGKPKWVTVKSEADYPDIGEEVLTASGRAGDRIIYEVVTWDEGEAVYAGPSHNSIIAYMPIPPYTEGE